MPAALDKVRRDIATVVLICRDPRTPWYARIPAACSVGYVFSPIQLIPDWVPVIGFLDDGVVVSLGIALLLKLTPADVVKECRERAAAGQAHGMPATTLARIAAAAVIGLWLLLTLAGAFLVFRLLRR